MPSIADGKTEVPRRAKGVCELILPEVLPQCCAPNIVLGKQVTPAKPGGWGADSAQWGAHRANPSCREPSRTRPPFSEESG